MRNKFLWQIANSLTIAVINIVFIMVMARYIPKAVHGEYTILLILNNFLLMFSQFGLGAALVQKESIDKRDVNTAFVINFIIGVVLYAILFVSASHLSAFFENKLEVQDIRLLGLTLILACLGSISLALLQRKFEFRKIFIVNATAYFIGYILIGFALAHYGFEIRAFIYAQLALHVLLSLTAYLLNPFQISFGKFKIKESMFFVKFGKEFTTIRLLSLVSGKIDKLILGKTLPLSFLANFEKAQYLTFLPPRFLGNLINGFLFSLFSRLQSENTKLFTLYSSIIGLVLLLVCHLCFIMLFEATQIIQLFYGELWLDIASLIKLFVFASPFITLAAFSDVLIRSKNRFKYSIRAKIFYLLGIVLSSLSSLYYPIENVIVFQILVTIVYALILNGICVKLLKQSWMNQRFSFKGLFVSLLFFSPFYVLREVLEVSFFETRTSLVLIEIVIILSLIIMRKIFFTRNQLELISKVLRNK